MKAPWQVRMLKQSLSIADRTAICRQASLHDHAEQMGLFIVLSELVDIGDHGCGLVPRYAVNGQCLQECRA